MSCGCRIGSRGSIWCSSSYVDMLHESSAWTFSLRTADSTENETVRPTNRTGSGLLHRRAPPRAARQLSGACIRCVVVHPLLHSQPTVQHWAGPAPVPRPPTSRSAKKRSLVLPLSWLRLYPPTPDHLPTHRVGGLTETETSRSSAPAAAMSIPAYAERSRGVWPAVVSPVLPPPHRRIDRGGPPAGPVGASRSLLLWAWLLPGLCFLFFK